MLVKEAMSTELVTCSIEASVADAGTLMTDHAVGSVIVLEAGDPVGIVTTTDLIATTIAADEAPSSLSVERALSAPLVTIEPSKTLRAATEKMADNKITRLPVVQGIDVVGIVTLTDLMYHFGDIKQEIYDLKRETTHLDDRFSE